MHEAFNQITTTTPPPSLRLVTEANECSEDTMIMEERDKIDDLVTRRNPTPEKLQMAFAGFSFKAEKLSEVYSVAGNRLADGNEGLYRLFITIPGHFSSDGPTTVDIGVTPDGDPDWKIDGPEIDDEFERKLVNLIEDTIAEARHN